jgi:hypothetical protein
VTLGLRLAFVLVLLAASSLVSAQTLSGRIVYLDGEVTVNGKPADTGSRLTGSCVLRTGKASVVEVVFADQNIFRLGAETVLKIDFSAAKKLVTLDRGLFTSVLRKLGKLSADPSFELRTPSVKAGVRGTSFHVTADENSTYFCTCNGSVELVSAGNATITSFNAHHGSSVFTRQADGAIAVAAGGLQDHTDATIEALARRIGVTVDWTVPDLASYTP